MVTLRETVAKCDWRALTECIFFEWRGFLNKALNRLFPSVVGNFCASLETMLILREEL